MDIATKRRKGEQGFTLIEIIAVLVILGILAAVAIPKYNDLQQQARIKTAMGALPALVSEATNAYHLDMLNSPTLAGKWAKAATAASVGDFTGTYSAATNVVKVGVTGVVANAAPSVWWDSVKSASGDMTYQFTLP